MLFSIKKSEWLGNERNDLFAGLVSSVAILPEVIGFAIIAGVHPLSAVFASAVTLLVITFTGGRPAMVSASAGSMALVLAGLIQAHGLSYMLAATILTGFLQFILGYLGIHKLMRFIPKTVMYGFVNALAILIFMAQVQQLPHQTLWSYGMIICSILLIYLLPKFITIVPPALIVILFMTILSYFLKGHLQTVGDLGEMSQFHPAIRCPNVPVNLETLWIILPSSVALAMVGLIESLLTIPIVDKMTASQSDSQREVKAQGFTNIITGFFGGQAGCAMIGQAVINVKSGGRKRLSTLISGITLLLFIFVFKSVMVAIPTAALIGIMMTVAVDTFDWESLQLFRTFEVTEIVILLVTVGVIVYTHNLAIGIILGVLLSGLLYHFFKKEPKKSC
ncbi:SulP family inorganic anion transporter [Enterococcus faecalis]|uniref:SulP family inorganic anion transporter n=1 Tax=Enterococcus TaxID=1350 RepID=UPI000353D22B|nr:MULTISPECIES: SulP family inorganic anion transporter [Enterococcus]EGO6029045.1 SulP family inorganic anion transporter [Enterococcus faecalis]EGO6643224.1 SulP family inorganic anion transporter [Enterococcus faecalis]EGO8331727.1 SulP family inorganic anion transporter [Enterococcus faecalis]EGO8788214.1 SulP family inorganic anion transporter [Enterococcus faecalis]EHE8516299.1 SulP family inorganic anion transporter [Enterococcus faecalis]